MLGDAKHISSYARKRLNNPYDDRTHEEKKWDDARLRGAVGTKKANEVIKMIDKYKSIK